MGKFVEKLPVGNTRKKKNTRIYILVYFSTEASILWKVLKKINMLWDMAPCRLVTSYRHFDLTATMFLNYLQDVMNMGQ